MSACRRWRCPSCGLFGRKARRRAAEVAEAGHIAWAAHHAAGRRDQAQLSLPCPICHAPDWAGWCCEVCDPLAEVPRVILGQPRM